MGVIGFAVAEADTDEKGIDMKQTFECVEKHLYRRQYQTAGGDWSTLYYVIFTDWKKKRRTFPVGSDLKTARDECKVLEARNIRKEDFDIKVESDPPERLTIAKYLPVFLQTKKGTKSYGFWKSCASHVDRLLGSIPLDEITRSKMANINNSAWLSRSPGEERRSRTLTSEPRQLTES